MRHSILLFLLLCFFSCKSGQKAADFDFKGMNPLLSEMVAGIVSDDHISTPSVGRSRQPSESYANRRALMDVATDEELVRLLDHPDGEVRVTAFEALQERGYSDMTEALMSIRTPALEVDYLMGDIAFKMPALEYAYVAVLGNAIPGEELVYQNAELKDIGLSAEQKAMIVKDILEQRGEISP
jgi:hypothetical protein